MPKIIDAERRRRDVIEAMWRIVLHDGVEHASLRRVAEECDLAIGSVRHYFGTHEDLVVAAAQAMVDKVSHRLEEHAARVPHTTDRRQLAEDLLGELLPLDDRRREEVSVWFAFISAARTNPALAAQARHMHEGTRKLAVAFLRHTRHSDDDVEKERLCAVIDGLAVGATLQPGLLPMRTVRDVLRRHLDELQQG